MLATVVSKRRTAHSIAISGAVAIVLAGALITVALVIVDERAAFLGPLFMASLVAVYWTWRRLPWADTYERYLSFGAVLLLACMLSRIAYLADFLLLPERFSEWPLPEDSPFRAVIEAELMTMLGTFLTLYTWWFAGGNRERIAPPDLDIARRAYWAIYFLSLIALASLRFDFMDPRVVGQSVPVIISGGLASCWLISTSRSGASPLRLLGSVVMVLPFLWLALGYAMKEAIIFSVLPAGMQAWLTVRSKAGRAALVVVVLLMLGWANSFTTFYRSLTWYGQDQVSLADAIVEHSQTGSVDTDQDYRGLDLSGFIQRANAAYHRGWIISLVGIDGFQPEFVFEPFLYVYIPRFLWPEKPTINPGLEITNMVWGVAGVGEASSSTAAGFYTALYLGAGWSALIIGAVLAGGLIALLMSLARRIGGEIFVGLFGFAMAMYALRFDEGWPIGAFSGPIITLVYMSILYTIVRFIVLVPINARSQAAVRPGRIESR